MSNAGMTFEAMQESMRVNVELLRKVTDELERMDLSGDVIGVKRIRAQLKEMAMKSTPAAERINLAHDDVGESITSDCGTARQEKCL